MKTIAVFKSCALDYCLSAYQNGYSIPWGTPKDHFIITFSPSKGNTFIFHGVCHTAKTNLVLNWKMHQEPWFSFIEHYEVIMSLISQQSFGDCGVSVSYII